MVFADWMAIVIVLGCITLGVFVGFGSGLKFFTGGIFGFIISIVVCGLFGTVFLDVGFIGDLLKKLSDCWAGNEFLTNMHLEVIIYYIILFVIVQILRVILVLIITKFLEADNFISKLLNKVLGAALFLFIGVLISLLILKIIGWVGGETAANLHDALKGSLFHLEDLFTNISNWMP